MAVDIDGVTYFTATEVVDLVEVSRQTLWRWRQDGSVPTGRRYRGRHIVFTAHEVELIRQFANRLEPIEGFDSRQLQLFDGIT